MFWELYDRRSDVTVGIAVYPSRESAERAIRQFTERDARGGRPDIHELIPYLGVRQQGGFDE